jgi:hypothetical protein
MYTLGSTFAASEFSAEILQADVEESHPGESNLSYLVGSRQLRRRLPGLLVLRHDHPGRGKRHPELLAAASGEVTQSRVSWFNLGHRTGGGVT